MAGGTGGAYLRFQGIRALRASRQSPRGFGEGLDKSAAFARRALRQGGAEASMGAKLYTRHGIVPDAFSLTTRVA